MYLFAPVFLAAHDIRIPPTTGVATARMFVPLTILTPFMMFAVVGAWMATLAACATLEPAGLVSNANLYALTSAPMVVAALTFAFLWPPRLFLW